MNTRMSTRGWKRFLYLIGVLAAVAPFVLTGCGDEDDGGPSGDDGPRTPNQAALSEAQNGWAKFEDGDYAGALVDFNDALAIEGDYLWALDGRAWSQMRLDDLSTAEANFDSALVHFDNWQDTASETDVHLGKAFVASARGDYEAAASHGSTAATLGGEGYEFRGDPSIHVDHARLVAAEAYVRLGLYDFAYNLLVEIDVTVLNRVNPESAAFVELLVEELERISLSL